ncbi:hypothetical protein BAE44_0015681 [Dichanthelium oligosanthes]|uniref:Uncharacterized protein n=1 Tax=Dichanthelium oligosanthes TaxID=888268 RepID=A0A1E5VDS4_9POAL|nr:hypothetical protein BAE44_0015681 [Dichanthelium oligosanthes]
MDKPEMREEINDVLDMKGTATDDDICQASILEKSSHRDGAIYKEILGDFLMDANDRNESKYTNLI